MLALDVVSCGAAINGCEKGKQWEGALDLQRKMLQQLLTPNVVSWSAGINAYEKAHQWEGALGLLRRMVH